MSEFNYTVDDLNRLLKDYEDGTLDVSLTQPDVQGEEFSGTVSDLNQLLEDYNAGALGPIEADQTVAGDFTLEELNSAVGILNGQGTDAPFDATDRLVQLSDVGETTYVTGQALADYLRVDLELTIPGADGELIFNDQGELGASNRLSFDGTGIALKDGSGNTGITIDDRQLRRGTPIMGTQQFFSSGSAFETGTSYTNPADIPTDNQYNAYPAHTSASFGFELDLADDLTGNPGYFYNFAQLSNFDGSDSSGGTADLNGSFSVGSYNYTTLNDVTGITAWGFGAQVVADKGTDANYIAGGYATATAQGSATTAEAVGLDSELQAYDSSTIDLGAAVNAEVEVDQNSSISRMFGFRQVGVDAHNAFEGSLSIGVQEIDIMDTYNPRATLWVRTDAGQTTPALQLEDNGFIPFFSVDTDGNTETSGTITLTTAGEGVVLTSDDGTRYKVTVNNDGSLDSTLA